MANRALRWLLLIIWYGLATVVVFGYGEKIIASALMHAAESEWSAGSYVAIIRAVIGLVVIAAVFILIHVGLSALRKNLVIPVESPKETSKTAFPAPITLAVGGWVLGFTFFALVNFLLVLRFDERVFGDPDLQGALITMLAAGIGSSIATILGYLKHACERKDFDPAYGAWYIGRPVIGLLLGLIFYFVIKGGLLVALQDPTQTMSKFGLAATGGLVGMFSKNAVEKLREVFKVLFQTKERSNNELLDRLPADLKDKVKPYLTETKDDAS